MVQLSSMKAGLEQSLTVPRSQQHAASDQAQDVGLANEIFSRHRNSNQPQSQQLCAILAAVLEVLQAQELAPTPTALYAALMSSLEKSETTKNSEVTAAMCHLLSIVLGRVPNSVLRSKFAASVQLTASVVESKVQETPVVKPALACLCQILAAVNINDWLAAAPSFNLLLNFALDTRPKVRKAAQSGLVDVLAGLQPHPAVLAQASDAVVKVCLRVLPGPEAAARIAAAAPSKKRSVAEEAITKAVSDALHLLEALKQTLFLVSGVSTISICDLLLKLYPLRQPLLSRHTTDVLTRLTSSSASHLSPKALSDLIGSVLAQESTLDRKDLDLLLAVTRFLESAIIKLHHMDPALSAARLPRAVHFLVPQLGAEQDTARFAAMQCLRNLINDCVDDALVNSALNHKGSAASPLQSVIGAIEASLGAQYQHVWGSCLPVAAELVERLGSRGGPLSIGLVQRLGVLCAGAEEEGEEEGVRDQVLLAAQSALGAALRSLGPDTVLTALPLNLIEGLQGEAEARTWLLPLMRLHVRGSQLQYWTTHLMPLARTLANRGVAASKDPTRKQEASICQALESQIWATLPSFCSWAQDTSEALRVSAKDLAMAYEHRPEVRTSICTALRRLCVQNKLAMKGEGHQVGYPDPSNVEDDEPGIEEEHSHLEVPPFYTAEVAEQNLQVIRLLGKSWLQLLLTSFVSTPSNQRMQLEATISAYACVCSMPTLAPLFRAAITKLIKVNEQAQTGELGPDAVLDGGDSDTQRRCTFMEAALALAGGLDDRALVTLYKAAIPALQEKDPAAQKKAYKILAYICEQRTAFLVSNFNDVLETVMAGVGTSMSAAKRYRLRCLKAVILALHNSEHLALYLPASEDSDTMSASERANQVVASMVGEIILCVKEANKKTRGSAYQLLVEIGHAFHAAQPPALTISDVNVAGSQQVTGGGLHTLFTMVLGGLVGATPHMVSASVMALARLLFEFAPILAGLIPELLPTVLILLRSKAREVIKSVLGFVKVVVMRLPADELQPFIPQILEGILLWCEDSKNKFRLKVRVIIERLARRCGFEALEKHVPQAHCKLLTHIRKQNVRKERRKSEAGSQMDWEVEDARSSKSRSKTIARTARTTDWNEDFFSEEDLADTGTLRSNPISTRKSASVKKTGKASSLRGSLGTEPVDLLDTRSSRRMSRFAEGNAPPAQHQDYFEHDGTGKMIIKEDKLTTKRKRNDGFDSDDSDFEDLKGFSGLSLALKGAKSVVLAPSISASLGGRSLGQKSKATMTTTSAKVTQSQKSHHDGDRFKSKKKNTGGDVKGASQVEPYAYWPLDRKMLNRRQQKNKTAKKGLEKMISAARTGAAKGRKAKRMRS